MLTDEEIMDIRNRAKLNDNRQINSMLFARDIERAVLAKVMQSDATGRSLQDYAIEHAEYMATSAEQLLNHLNECTNIDDCVIEPDENFSDYTSGLRLSIHDFRKRRDRAKTMPIPKQEPFAHAVYQGCLSGVHVSMLSNAPKDFSGYLYSAPQPEQAAIPYGYCLAPKEPTASMLDAGVAMALQVSVHGEGGWSKYLLGLYKQMLSASPKPE